MPTAAVLSSSWAGAAWAAGGRVALVIGNAVYEHVPLLANPGNDARAVGEAFERLGYAVTRLEDAGYDALRRSLLDFTRAAAASEVAVVFYAGHGMEVDGCNFLVPVDAALARDADMEYEAAPLDLVTRAVGGCGAARAGGAGCVPGQPVRGEAGGRGVDALDRAGSGACGTLGGDAGGVCGGGGEDGGGRWREGAQPVHRGAAALPGGAGVGGGPAVPQGARRGGAHDGGSQTPIEYGKLPDADIYLASGPGPIVGGGTTTPPPPPPPPSLGPARAYEAAERMGTVAAFQAFIKRYPHSYEATLAKEQIAKLEHEADDAAFARAKRLHTASGYNDYLSSYPSGRHEVEARALLAEVTKPPEWAPGQKFRDCAECPEMVVVPSGSFEMGSPGSESGWYDDEGPVHRVEFARPFAVGVTR